MKLRECPFCGRYNPRFIESEHEPYFIIKCADCPGEMQFYSSTKEQAIQRWNTRTVDPLITQLGEALSGLIQRPAMFYVYHTNIEDGDYLECRFCEGESPCLDVRSASVVHKDKCEYAAAREALSAFQEVVAAQKDRT